MFRATSLRSLVVLATSAMTIMASLAHAQSWPSRPIRMIVPFANDLLARPVAAALSESLGQSVIVEQIIGGQTILGTQTAARAAPDGHTILLITNSHAINESLRSDKGYNLMRDFAPITQLNSFPLVLVVHPSVPANSVTELIALAKSQPGKLAYASSGPVYQLPTEMFKSMAKVDILHIPYKSSATARLDVISGRVQMTMDALTTQLPFIKAQRVRPLAVSGKKRSQAAPELPTIAEAALPGYDGDGWYGFLAPAGTPQPIVARLQSEIAKYLAQPEVRAWYVQQAVDPVGSKPDEYQKFLKEEIAKWAQVVQASGAKAE